MFDIHATTTPAFIVSVDGDDLRISDVNAACLEAGLGRDDHSGRPRQNVPLLMIERRLADYRICIATNKPITYDTEVALPSGPRVWRTSLIPFAAADTHQVVSLVGFCQDCTQDRIAQKVNDAIHEKLSMAIGAIEGGFWIFDIAAQTFETSKPLAELIAGPGHQTLSLAEYAGHIHADDLGMDALAGGSTREYRVITHEGRTRWLQSKRRVIRNAIGRPSKVVGLVLDITEQKAALRALESEASTDALTSLTNRRGFDRVAARAFCEAKAGRETIGLVLFDLDGFKPINDRYGHRAGDEILRKVARRIARCAGDGDVLARIGGDEFAILLRTASAEAGDALGAKVCRAFEKPFTLDGLTIFVGISMGVTVSRPRDASIEALFERADQALYAMKRQRHQLTA